MKRILVVSAVFGMFLGITAFQCSSTELTSAKLYVQQKNYAKAKTELLKDVKKNPLSDEGYYYLGVVYDLEGKTDSMLYCFDKSLEVSKRFETDIKNARKVRWAEDFNKGASFVGKAGKVKSQDSIAMFYEKAINSFKSSVLCEPDSAQSIKYLYYVCSTAKKVDEAVEPLTKLMEKGKSPDAFVCLGELNINKGTASKDAKDSVKAEEYFGKAIDVLTKGRELFPNNSDILLLASQAYISANRMKEANDAFRTGVEKEPANKYYRYGYGVLLLQDKKFEAAETQFKKAVELDPSYSSAIYNLAATYVNWGVAIRQQTEIDTNNPNAKAAEDYKVKFQAARTVLEEYLKQKPEEANLWETLGRVYANLGMTKESTAAFDQAQKLRK